jgi:hypothetical protein
MFFMVIEHFSPGRLNAVRERFATRGRMLPDNVIYHASWMDETGSSCFQLMEAPDRPALDPWIYAWTDLVDFEIIPVLTSADFWSRFPNA